MNEDQAIGQWKRFKGDAKKIWGDLTDDDFKSAEGSIDKFYGFIQEKYGDTKEMIKSKLDQIRK